MEKKKMRMLRDNNFQRLLCFAFASLVFLGVAKSQVEYPFPLRHVQLTIGDTSARMAYMDVAPSRPNGRNVLLLHGKNFNGYYWKDAARFLSESGYRVIIPDQVGWGRSDKPIINYSFHQLAYTTSLLLDSLGISRTIIIGHSMGGMLATRFSLMFPNRVEKLILENPIGLEDYRRFVPYQPLAAVTANERKATYQSYKQYQQSYYPAWKPEYEQYVAAQAEQLTDPNFADVAVVNALTYQMIIEQPVCYEFELLVPPTLLIIGQEDRTVVGKNLLTDEQKKKYGNYPQLGKKTKQQIPGASLIELPGVGHIPHIQEPRQFKQHVLAFIN